MTRVQYIPAFPALTTAGGCIVRASRRCRNLYLYVIISHKIIRYEVVRARGAPPGYLSRIMNYRRIINLYDQKKVAALKIIVAVPGETFNHAETILCACPGYICEAFETDSEKRYGLGILL